MKKNFMTKNAFRDLVIVVNAFINFMCHVLDDAEGTTDTFHPEKLGTDFIESFFSQCLGS
jgi:hypothetical protein